MAQVAQRKENVNKRKRKSLTRPLCRRILHGVSEQSEQKAALDFMYALPPGMKAKMEEQARTRPTNPPPPDIRAAVCATQRRKIVS